MTFAARFHDGLTRLRTRDRFRLPPERIPAHFRRAAVLLPFWPDPEADDVCVLMTRRAVDLAQHAGQTSFPGGRLDAGERWVEAALREAHEEVGLDPHSVEVLGPLDEAWSGAGHHIVPIVGWLRSPPILRANPSEVAAILVARVSEILRPESRGEIEVVHRGVRYRNPTLTFAGGDAHGLSADLLLEAIEWGTGGQPDLGPIRLEHLRTYFA